MIQISYLVNLIPHNCAIPEWLTTCKYSDFWRNEHVFSYVTILVTVSKGSSTYVSACIELLSARVLQFETLRGLTIMLEVCVCVCVCVGRGQWKRYNPWVANLTMNFQNLLSRRKILSKVFNSHVVCYIITNNLFASFEISGGSYNPSQNTLRLIHEFEKYIPSFMESLIADFILFSSVIAKF